MLLIAVGTALCIFIVLMLLINVVTRRRDNISQRMQHYAGETTYTSGNTDNRQLRQRQADVKMAEYQQRLRDFVKFFAQRIKEIPQARELDMKMQQAGFPLVGSEYIIILCTLGAVMWFVGLVLTLNFSIGVLFGTGTMLFGMFYLRIRIAKRRQAFTNQLGDVLVMMANALRSGFSFLQAVEMVAKEMKPPVSVEFAKMLAELRLGVSTENALNNMSHRVGSSDFDLVITAVLIHRQVGGNLASIFDSISNTINERIRMKNEVKSLTAQGRMSGWVLAGLPFAVGGGLLFLNPHYMDPLLESPLGIPILCAGLVSQVIGIIVINKIVDIDT